MPIFLLDQIDVTFTHHSVPSIDEYVGVCLRQATVERCDRYVKVGFRSSDLHSYNNTATAVGVRIVTFSRTTDRRSAITHAIPNQLESHERIQHKGKRAYIYAVTEFYSRRWASFD